MRPTPIPRGSDRRGGSGKEFTESGGGEALAELGQSAPTCGELGQPLCELKTDLVAGGAQDGAHLLQVHYGLPMDTDKQRLRQGGLP